MSFVLLKSPLLMTKTLVPAESRESDPGLAIRAVAVAAFDCMRRSESA